MLCNNVQRLISGSLVHVVVRNDFESISRFVAFSRSHRNTTKRRNVGFMIKRSRVQISPTAQCTVEYWRSMLLAHTCLCHHAVWFGPSGGGGDAPKLGR